MLDVSGVLVFISGRVVSGVFVLESSIKRVPPTVPGVLVDLLVSIAIVGSFCLEEGSGFLYNPAGMYFFSVPSVLMNLNPILTIGIIFSDIIFWNV